MSELIITEKPNSAKKIAEALSDGKLNIEKAGGVNIYRLKHKGKEISVVSAVGHLYSLTEKNKTFKYPVFDIEWKPTSDIDKKAAFSKKYLNVIKKLSKESKTFTIACDYDIEGEVIGLNIVKYACGQKDASRMKFSTLVKDDLIESYEHKSPTLDWGQALAGETRHFLDWLYGINLSRALMLAMKNTGRFKVMSSGRVQGPALKIIVDKEKEIKAFKSTPYWQITLNTSKNRKLIEALHEKDKFEDQKEAKKIFNSVEKEKETTVSEIKSTSFNQNAPNPFDLGTLQTEAYKLFSIQPKDTLQIAQSLYQEGLTSYPRTSSQQIPKELGYTKLLKALSSNPEYKDKAQKVLSMKSISPNNGKKTDPAHPAIYPTGIIPKNIGGREKKVYDLVVKRFLATFGEPAVRETMNISFKVKNEKFLAKGTKTTFAGWHTLYEPYVKLKDEEFPTLKEGEKLPVKKIELLQKETQPPKRFTPASIISELEKRGLGTKATRAEIVENLFQRGYVQEKSIEATELGIKVESTLEKYVPEILDEELTRKFEEEMDLIREGKNTKEKVLQEAKLNLTKLLEHFKQNEEKIGNALQDAETERKDLISNLGPCPVCKDGNIVIKKGKFGFFAACDKYPDCKTTFSLPKMAMIKPTGKVSLKGYPVILVVMKGKAPQELSLNAEENMKVSDEDRKLLDNIKSGSIEKKCEKCGANMRVMSSIFGEFLGCSKYPKCNNTISFNGNGKNGNGNTNKNSDENSEENKNTESNNINEN